MSTRDLLRIGVAGALLLASAGWNLAGPNSGKKDAATGVTGEVTVIITGNGAVEKDASRVVVWLVPRDTMQPVSVSAQRPRYRLVQHNKKFEPGLLVVPVGSVVDFPNLDPWFHNVFSLYRGKRFDLGLYQAGSQKSVRFDRPGPSYLFCNIHPEMTGVVLAIDSETFGITDKDGRYSIVGVAPGKYILHVWYENAMAESLPALQRQINIEEGGQILPSISVRSAKHMFAEHKNKYGQDYDPDTLKTDY